MKDGYYWVKEGNIWIIAEYEYGVFWLSGSDRNWNKEDFDEIGDYIETPEKYKDN